MSTLSSDIIKDKADRFNGLKDKRLLWDKVENLFHGILNDSLSTGTKSQVFDPRLASLIIERAYRVMAQLGIGKVVGIGQNDMGDAKLKNLLLEKYVIPNANAQFDLLTKFRMVDMYSNLYGSFDVLVDWNVRGVYTGPDMWLLNKRDVFLPLGAVSIEDSDDVVVRTWRPISFFKSLEGDKSFKNVKSIVELLEKKAGSKGQRDSENISKREEAQYTEKGPDGFYEVLTRYEKDRWVDICTDADMEFRDQKNPQENNELPLVRKHSIPLIDDADGLGDGERGSSMQMVENAIWNLYLDAVKMSIYPPLLLNKDNIASMSSIKWGAAAKWLVRNNLQNAVSTINLTPQGISTFNNTFQAANASLLNVFGTSDTTVTAQQDAGFGKTPQALKMQNARESTRDNADRYYMEKFVNQVMRKMVNLLGKKQSSSISLRMFPDEIQKIAREYPEIQENYDQGKGTLTIPKGKKSLLYDYEIVSGSTFAADEQAEQENLAMLMEVYSKSQTPQGNMLVADLAKSGFTFNFGELFKRVISKGIKDWDKILDEMTDEERANTTLEQDQMAFQQAIMQMQQGGQGMGQVPPIPGQPGQVPPEMGGMPEMGGQL